MRSILSLQIIAFLLIFSCASEQKETNSAIEEVDNLDQIVKNGNSLLWRVSGPDIQTSYLFGTMHMINKEYFTFPDFLKSKIEDSETLIMEVDGIPNPLTTYQLLSLDTGTVHSYFTKEQHIELLRFMDQEMGLSPEVFDLTYGKMKPFLIMQTITQQYFEADAQSYDLIIMALAAENNIPIVGLETTEEQLGFFDKISRESMADLVMESIYSFEKEQKEMNKLMQLYAKQKVDKLIPLLQKQSPEFMEFADIFLYDRNKRWIPKLIKEMQKKKSFVAVGAGHLFGEKGVIDLLKKEGYEISAINMNPVE
ncbi:MAG: TraB/GumN family protein [Crocinitomicaceae bacterium]